MENRKVIFYFDEENDEFSKAKITPKRIDENYVYVFDSKIKKFTHFFWYRLVATPLAFLYTKTVFSHKVIGREKLDAYKDKAYFFYGNHTQATADAVIPSLLNFPKTDYVIVHPNNVSMPYLGRVTPSMGALPTPDTLEAHRKFIAAIEQRLSERHAIVIYPEAHIWPYYTGIRNFSDISFTYPVKYDTPVFCFTNTYQKRRFGKFPRIVTYIDGPFFFDKDIPKRKARKKLRDLVYDTMCKRAELSDVEKIKYIRRDVNG